MLKSTGFSLEDNNNLLFTVYYMTPFQMCKTSEVRFMRTAINGYQILRFTMLYASRAFVYNARYLLDR